MKQNMLDHHLMIRMGLPEAQGFPTPTQVRTWQMQRLRELVSHSQTKSPFYKRHLENVTPSSIHTPEDFSTLPTMTADDIRQNPESLLCVSQDEIERVVTLQSSGTTGEPKRIFHTSCDLTATQEYFSWGMANMLHAGQTALILMPGERPGSVGRLLERALEDFGAKGISHGVMNKASDVIQQIMDENVQCIVGPPAHVNMVAKEWSRQSLGTEQIKSVLLCWDSIPTEITQSVCNGFGCDVFRHWGMVETGLGGAVECAPGSGMHLRETDVYVEIIDPDSGGLLPDGRFGEIVVSTPLKMGMPLIRYRTGDMGRIQKGDCPCGSPLRRLDPTIYRRDDSIHIGTGQLSLKDLSSALYDLAELDDFSAEFSNETLRVTVSGQASMLENEVRAKLDAIPVISRGVTTTSLAIDVSIHEDGSPALPGLGKRRIQTKGRNDI